jgi:AcrR family transcriptional regulator
MTAAQPDHVRATDGRVPGRRGIATRQKLLDCLAVLLAKHSYRDIKVIDIAREAGTSPATFYQYFPGVEQAVLVLAEKLDTDAAFLSELVGRDWRGDRGFDTARAVVEGFLEYYESHRAVFRVVDLATEEGDLRFQRLRTRALSGITQALAETILAFQHEGRAGPEGDATATAFVLTAMLAHCAAHRYGFEFHGVRTAEQVETLSRILFWSVTGRRPPAGPAKR